MSIKAKRVFTPKEIKNQNSNKYSNRKKKYRIRRKDIRNKSRKENYKSTRPEIRKRREWTPEECDAILNWDMCTDKEIGLHFNRSVQAIQQKRYKLNAISKGK